MSTPTDSNDMFLRASRKKLRFASSRGALSVEDLWDLSLEALDKIAVSTDRQLKESSSESFLAKKTETEDQKSLALGLEILKAVISIKQAEVAARAERVQKQQQRATLLELKEKKQFEKMAELSIEDIDKQLEQLK